MADSAVASGVYTISSTVCATPTFNPVAGTYGSTQSVTISTSHRGRSHPLYHQRHYAELDGRHAVQQPGDHQRQYHAAGHRL